MQERSLKTVPSTDVLDTNDTVPISQLEIEEDRVLHQEEEDEWEQQFEYLLDNYPETS